MPQDLPAGDEVVTRRYEFFKYIGPIDAESGEAMADTVGPDGSRFLPKTVADALPHRQINSGASYLWGRVLTVPHPSAPQGPSSRRRRPN